MRFNGRWTKCDDGILRPLVEGQVVERGGEVLAFDFILDTGADRTVLNYEVLSVLDADLELDDGFRLQGVGGEVDSAVIATTLWLVNDTGEPMAFHGRFAALSEPGAEDFSLLGRDVLRDFAVIVDRPGDVVCMLHGRHRYIIQQT